MDMPRNTSSTPSPRRVQIGLWCSLCSNVAIEVVSHSGYDWLLLDTEHSPNDVTDILVHLQAAQSGTASLVVRPAWNDMVLIKRYLDIGAQTLLIPFVQIAGGGQARGRGDALSAEGRARHHQQRTRQPLRPGEGLREERLQRDLPAGAGRNPRGAQADRGDRVGRRRRRRVHRAGRPVQLVRLFRQLEPSGDGGGVQGRRQAHPLDRQGGRLPDRRTKKKPRS